MADVVRWRKLSRASAGSQHNSHLLHHRSLPFYSPSSTIAVSRVAGEPNQSSHPAARSVCLLLTSSAFSKLPFLEISHDHPTRINQPQPLSYEAFRSNTAGGPLLIWSGDLPPNAQSGPDNFGMLHTVCSPCPDTIHCPVHQTQAAGVGLAITTVVISPAQHARHAS